MQLLILGSHTTQGSTEFERSCIEEALQKFNVTTVICDTLKELHDILSANPDLPFDAFATRAFLFHTNGFDSVGIKQRTLSWERPSDIITTYAKYVHAGCLTSVIKDPYQDFMRKVMEVPVLVDTTVSNPSLIATLNSLHPNIEGFASEEMPAEEEKRGYNAPILDWVSRLTKNSPN